MSNPETPKTASDLVVSASACVVEDRVAGVLAEHLMYEDGSCSGCDFHVDDGLMDIWEVQFSRHQASVVAALPDIAIVISEDGKHE